jgi:hypothetical protein
MHHHRLLVPGAAEEEQDALDAPSHRALARVIAADLLQYTGVDPGDALGEDNERVLL